MEQVLILYLRLSKEEERKQETQLESGSIRGQRILLQGFLEKDPMLQTCPKMELIDDGYSGRNQNRPGFLRMLELIRQKRVRGILTKDLSRLGRNYVETGWFQEVFCPSHNVWLIAVNDGYDSRDLLQRGVEAAFHSILNEMYSRDLSKKIRCVLEVKKAQGNYMGSVPPYGYCFREETGQNRLYVEEKAAEVVRMIYRKKLMGESTRAIAEYLTIHKILTPAQYQKRETEDSPSPIPWPERTVGRILHNPVYCGILENHKTAVSFQGGRNYRQLPVSDHYFFRNRHEAIVSEQDFFRLNQKIEQLIRSQIK